MNDFFTNVKNGKLLIQEKEGEKSYFKQKEAHNKCLLKLCIEHIDDGRRPADETFSKDVWEDVISRLNEEIRVIIDQKIFDIKLGKLTPHLRP